MKQTIALVFLCLLAACQAGQRLPTETVGFLRGCWIEHRDNSARTFRWFPMPDEPDLLLGEYIDDTPVKVTGSRDSRWWIDQRGRSAELCLSKSRNSKRTCWTLASVGKAEPDHARWAIIRASNEALVILVHDGDGQREVFSGVRDGCD